MSSVRSVRLSEFEQTFLGGCKGIGLKRRGSDDSHVCFVILTEDDGNWFVSDSSASSFWMPELQSKIAVAIEWMKANCDKDSSGFGYRFR